MEKIKVSIVIPVYNEEKRIDGLLECLVKLKGEHEVIFVDGNSQDNTVRKIDEIIKNDDKFSLIVSEKGRSNQMNAGAKVSRGEILFFLHADSYIGPDTIINIENSARENAIGCLKIRFDSKKLIMKICSYMSSFRVRKRKIAFGDQGMFIFKSTFERLGGFSNIPIMEDYDLSIRAKDIGMDVFMIDSEIITDDIRYRRSGYLKTMWKMQKYQQKFRLSDDKKKAAQEIASLYRKL